MLSMQLTCQAELLPVDQHVLVTCFCVEVVMGHRTEVINQSIADPLVRTQCRCAAAKQNKLSWTVDALWWVS